MSDVACPNCRGVMSSPSELSGKWVACPFCHQQFVLPEAKQLIPAGNLQSSAGVYVAPPVNDFAPAGYAPPRNDLLNGVRIPILISGIFNAMVAVIWALTCFGLILTVPLAILCTFELCYYSNSARMPPYQAIREGRTLAIYEIVVGVLSLNMVVLACGILALVMANQAQERLAQTPAAY